jgi:hypothetical protein
VLAFFLPLKAILLLAHEGVPRYLISLITAETKDAFVLGIAIAAIACYGLHLLCEWMLRKVVHRGSQRIIERNKKLHLFDNQADFASDCYQRLCRTVASAILVLLGFALGFYVDPILFGLLAGMVIIEFAALQYLFKSSTQLGAAVVDIFRIKQGVAFHFLSSSNFLIGFGILFGQFLATDQRNVIVAIICILLLRQVMNRLSVGIQDLIYLAKNRLKLNALFYSSIQYTPPQNKQQDTFLASMTAPVRNEWLTPLLSELLDRPVVAVTSTWVDSGMSGVAYLEVEAVFHTADAQEGADDSFERKQYFVKCYHKSRAALAAHEVQLFTLMPNIIPCVPIYLGQIYVRETRVLIFAGVPNQKPTQKQWKTLLSESLIALWSLPPDNTLAQLYLRTHPTISRRLKPEMLSQMAVAVENDYERLCLERLIVEWPKITKRIEQLPLSITNREILKSNCRIGDNQSPKFLSWNRWAIEPIGCGAAVLSKEKELLESALLKASRRYDESKQLEPDDLLLVSQLYEIENALKRQKPRLAVKIVTSIYAESLAERNALKS